MMTKEDRAALREAAEKATPGPWRARFTIYEHMIAGIAARGAIAEIWKGERGMEDARYIALAHPGAVLALLDERERMREALRLSLRAWGTTGVSNGAIREAQIAARVALDAAERQRAVHAEINAASDSACYATGYARGVQEADKLAKKHLAALTFKAARQYHAAILALLPTTETKEARDAE